jgi:hypothetical protein
MNRPATDPLTEGLQILSDELGIPMEHLWKLRPSELEPLWEASKLKIRSRLAEKQAEMDKMLAEDAAELAAHPLWRAHVREKGASQ